jgi:hypothetical protein
LNVLPPPQVASIGGLVLVNKLPQVAVQHWRVHPASVVDKPGKGQAARPPHYRALPDKLLVSSVGFVDQSTCDKLVVQLPDRAWVDVFGGFVDVAFIRCDL